MTITFLEDVELEAVILGIDDHDNETEFVESKFFQKDETIQVDILAETPTTVSFVLPDGRTVSGVPKSILDWSD